MNNKSQTLDASIDELSAFATATGISVSELSGHRVYQVSGDDASEFLQGQFCNDLAQASDTHAQITGYCTPKGRLLALPTLVGCSSGYRMLVSEDVADAFIKRLSMFVMRSNVVIEPLSDWSAVGITFDEATHAESVSEQLGALPVGEFSSSTSEAAQLIRWHADYTGAAPRARFIRLAPIQDQHDVISKLSGASMVSPLTWRLSDISAGVPSITNGVVEAFVPQMVNLQLIDGLSFTKGCYPGQEIVARMQYLGKLKRHMRVFSMPIDQAMNLDDILKPGATLESGSDENAGVVVDGMPLASDQALVLAVTKVLSEESAFRLAGAQLQAHPMPYDLPSLEVA